MAAADLHVTTVIALADTSPLHYLVLLGAIDHLPRLFDVLIVPPAVVRELRHPRAPAAVGHWAAHPPTWLQVPPAPRHTPLPPRLGPGEREVLALRPQYPEAVLLLDDRHAVRAATQRDWAVLGTLGLLRALAAAPAVRLDLPDALTRLRATNFRVTDAQVTAVLRAATND